MSGEGTIISNDEAAYRYESDSPESTMELGRALGTASEPGLVVALCGPLGAGKTQLIRGVAEGLLVPDSRVVTSPTFVLVQEYEGRLPIYHFDTYRLANSDQFASLGVEEYFFGDGVSLVEWADRVPDCLPPDRLTISIEVTGESSRTLSCRATGPIAIRVLNRMSDLT